MFRMCHEDVKKGNEISMHQAWRFGVDIWRDLVSKSRLFDVED
jgi:hypothetical protein